MIEIHELVKLELQEVQNLVDSSVEEGFRFLDRLVKEWQTGINRFNQNNEKLYQVHNGGKLIGIGGINQDPYSDFTSIGRIRRFYIHPLERRKGVGRQLIERIIEDHKDYYLEFRLRTSNEIASQFYESIGFIKIPNSATYTHQLKFVNN